LDGAEISAKVSARNLRGNSAFSSPGKGGKIPKKPDDPTNVSTKISGKDVLISWTEPNANGTPIS